MHTNKGMEHITHITRMYTSGKTYQHHFNFPLQDV